MAKNIKGCVSFCLTILTLAGCMLTGCQTTPDAVSSAPAYTSDTARGTETTGGHTVSTMSTGTGTSTKETAKPPSSTQEQPAGDKTENAVPTTGTTAVTTASPSGPVSSTAWEQKEFYLSTFISGTDLEQVKWAKEGGLNLLEFAFSTPAYMEKALDYCDDVGIRCMVYDQGSITSVGDKMPLYNERSFANAVYKYYDHESVIGYYIWDEVDKSLFASARVMVDYVKKYDPARLAYLILYPSYGVYNWSSSPVDWENSAYYYYVDDYLKTVNPQVLSFDYYPFYNNPSSLSISDWYRDMGLMRKKAAEYGKPFWYYYQTHDLKDHNIALSPGQIRVQMYTGLAYGAKYLSSYNAMYYMYTDSGKTANFESAKAINNEVMAMGRYLFDKTPTRLYHTGAAAVNSSIYYLDDLTASDLIASAPDDLILSVFEDGKTSTKYLLVVTKNFTSGASGTITLKSSKAVGLLSKSGSVQQVSPSADSISFSLEAGGGALYVIK